MAKIAQEVIDINGYSDVINVVAKRSTEMHVGEGFYQLQFVKIIHSQW